MISFPDKALLKMRFVGHIINAAFILLLVSVIRPGWNTALKGLLVE